MQLTWQLVHHRGLTARQTYDMLHLRGVVFVDEQHVSAALEIDGRDLEGETHHLFGWDGADLLAYARLLEPDEHGASHVGRVVVATDARGGTGTELVRRAVAACEKLWPATPIMLGAQDHLRGFYGRHGFQPVGDIYEEAGIPHIDMVRKPA
ncbi:GNAT family N-acetyltransferase [Nocardioides jejuensis]|uniref:GNAT family N-acetyltransferase n=1 Tax=Nocardioides jejuensis TaxID=2502782 RepID=A0A4R1C3J2_9ACTN|nr:GNAT family N-acetyltransferase [Nocardioides jejuensis]TCJ24366.1 GNAT family N-acetyltransferase [Nocardioides jejuensis]